MKFCVSCHYVWTLIDHGVRKRLRDTEEEKLRLSLWKEQEKRRRRRR